MPIAGIAFPWEQIAGYYMRICSFTRFADVQGDKVVGSPDVLGYGYIKAELPNPDVALEQRIITLPIKHKSDYKSVFRAHLDSGVKSGLNELIILCEQRSGLFGRPKPCIHVAGYPEGTWQGFFDAVDRYASGEFRWPPPLFLYSPTANGPFPASKGLTTNSFSP